MKALVTANSPEERKLLRQGVLIAGAFLLLDQVSKVLAERNLMGNPPRVVIPRFFNLVYVENTGAAWGMGGGWSPLVFIVISVLVLFAGVFWMRALTEGRPERYYALALIASGILGNGIDRVWRGAVVDFLDFYLGRWHWPAFNVADSAICVGVTVFLISSLFFSPDKASGKADGCE